MLYSPSTGGFYDFVIHGNRVPTDCVEITQEYYLDLLAGQSAGQRIVADATGNPVLQAPPAPTAEDIIKSVQMAVQLHMDLAAKAAGYDDIKSAVTYAEEPSVPKFQAEGQALRAWRSLVWEKCYAIMAQATSGEIPIPSPEQVVADLPALTMPA